MDARGTGTSTSETDNPENTAFPAWPLAAQGVHPPLVPLTERVSMLIQLNTDNHVDGRDEAMRQVETELERSLARFASQITRVEVHFQDSNADKSGAADKRCMLEARVSGSDPIAVTNTGESLAAAFHGARDKLVRVLDRRLAKLRPPKGLDPFDRPTLDNELSL